MILVFSFLPGNIWCRLPHHPFLFFMLFIATTECLPIYQVITSTAVKKGGLSTGDVGVLYKYKNSVIDVKADTASNVGHSLHWS